MGFLVGSQSTSVHECVKADPSYTQDQGHDMGLSSRFSKDSLNKGGSKETCQSKEQGEPASQQKAFRDQVDEYKTTNGNEDKSVQK
jgi:hypothetical protein